jgi:hypothetical protein
LFIFAGRIGAVCDLVFHVDVVESLREIGVYAVILFVVFLDWKNRLLGLFDLFDLIYTILSFIFEQVFFVLDPNWVFNE